LSKTETFMLLMIMLRYKKTKNDTVKFHLFLDTKSNKSGKRAIK